jgi:hypothetical protein
MVSAMTTRALSFLLIAFLAFTSGIAFAGKTYVDTKKRFSLELEAGWELAPLPGDTQGMVFRKKANGVPGTLRVSVRPLRPGETTKETLDELEDAAKNELGYKAGGDLPTSVGGLPAVRRTFSVFASGDSHTVRSIELIALHAFGHAHVLHFETLENKRGSFTRDLDRMIASYQALVGKGVYASLVGTWINQGGGPDLVMEEDGRFQLGPLKGGYQADGGQLVLRVAEGAESYRYVQVDNTLTLSSPNLGEDMKFRLSGAQRIKSEDKKPIVTGPLTREQLIGSWRVVDAASTDVLKLQLAPSGSVSFGGLSGSWRYSTGRLTIVSTANVTITYSASLNDGKLVLGGGDLDRELTLVRE